MDWDDTQSVYNHYICRGSRASSTVPTPKSTAIGSPVWPTHWFHPVTAHFDMPDEDDSPPGHHWHMYLATAKFSCYPW